MAKEMIIAPSPYANVLSLWISDHLGERLELMIPHHEVEDS